MQEFQDEVIHEQLIVIQLVKKFLSEDGIRTFITSIGAGVTYFHSANSYNISAVVAPSCLCSDWNLV
jgi:hypothetical protein